MGLNYGFNPFNTFSTPFTLMFVVILIVFVINAFRGFAQWNQNNHSPRLTVFAVVTSKRINVSHGAHSNTDVHHGSTTWYYVTFQVESGDRMEFTVSGPEYGMLSEGDEGSLSFQGTRYLSFERIPAAATGCED